MKRNRKPYGKELAEKVRQLYFQTTCSVAMVARHFKISESTVSDMIDKKEAYKNPKEEKIMIELTQEQLKHFESIKWLIGGPLACGKSTVLAMAFIDYAMKNPGQRVRVFDHEREAVPYSNRFILDYIQHLIPTGKTFIFHLIDHSIEYKKPEEAQDE